MLIGAMQLFKFFYDALAFGHQRMREDHVGIAEGNPNKICSNHALNLFRRSFTKLFCHVYLRF